MPTDTADTSGRPSRRDHLECARDALADHEAVADVEQRTSELGTALQLLVELDRPHTTTVPICDTLDRLPVTMWGAGRAPSGALRVYLKPRPHAG